MSMDIGIEHNVKEAVRLMSVKQNKQVPFAASMAINFTADDVAQEVTRQMDRYLDRPTPFTKKAFVNNAGRFKGKRATKRRLEAIIIAGTAQARYLSWAIFGGTRNTGANKNLIPSWTANLNKYGNIPGKRKGVANKPKHFEAEINGVRGIWQRLSTSELRLVALVNDKATYKPLFPIFKIAKQITRKNFSKNFDKAMKQAMRTAK